MHELIQELEQEREKLGRLVAKQLAVSADQQGLISEVVLAQSQRVDSIIWEIERQRVEHEA